MPPPDPRPRVRVIALGSRTDCDDEAALRAVESIPGSSRGSAELVLAGRPGPGLIDLLAPDRPTVVVDAVQAGLPPGALVELRLGDLVTSCAPLPSSLSSHGLGPAETFRLAQALGRPLPPGVFLGIEAGQTEPGRGLSAAVLARLPALRSAIESAIATLEESPTCTKPESFAH